MAHGRHSAETIGIPQEFQLLTGTNGHSRKLKFLITGGCGYFGLQLAKSVHALGAYVKLLDLNITPAVEKCLDDRFTFVKGDICDYQSVSQACCDVDCVFHAASFGMSGSAQLCKELTELVNVEGTKNVIKACQENGVNRLVYTSSYNVVLDGKEIVSGDESLSYADPAKMTDYYSISKRIADELVLAANETETEGGGLLRTCCLRPCGIYGPGERKHTSRVVGFIKMNILVMKPGNAICDWIHVNNLVQAHILAVPALSEAQNHIAAGKAYFVSDNNPIPVFDFLKPVFAQMNSHIPKLTCPYLVMYFLAFLNEMLHFLLKPLIVIEPFLTRNEAMKMGLDHYHSMKLIMEELHYRPKKYDFADTVATYLAETSTSDNPPVQDGPWNLFASNFKLFFALIIAYFVLTFFLSY